MSKAAKERAERVALSLDEAVLQINQKYGRGTIVLASEAKALTVRKFSTGSLALDIALGGGFAEGRMIEIIGAFSSYKSTTITKAIQSYLSLGRNRRVVIVDPEKAFELKWFKFLGGDASRVYLTWPTSGEEAGDVICDLMRLAAKDQFLIVVDSIAALEPQKNLEERASVGDAAMGKHARLMSEMLRKMTALLDNDLTNPNPRITMIFSNQIRMKIGMFVGNPETGTGGRAREFYMSQQITLKRDEFVTEEVGSGEDRRKQTFGARIRYQINKNKTGGPPNESGYLTFMNTTKDGVRGGQFDNAADLMPLALLFDIVSRDKNTWRFNNYKATGEQNFINIFRKDPEALEDLYAAILAAHKDKFQSRGDEEEQEPKPKKTIHQAPQLMFRR